MADLRLRSPLYQLHVSAWLLVITASLVLNLVHNQGSGEDFATTLLYLFVACAGALLVRCWRLRLDVRGDEVVVRNWFRTRTIQTSDVSEVVLKAYDGLWSRGCPYNWIACLAVTTKQADTVTAWGLVHTRGVGRFAARRLSERLGVPLRDVDKWGRTPS